MILLSTWVAVLLLISYAIGRTCLLGLENLAGSRGNADICFSIAIPVGIAGITAVAQIFSLVGPTGWGLALGVFTAAVIAVWLNRRSILEELARWMVEIRKAPVGIIIVVAAVAAVVIYKGSDIPFNYDTGLYHAQAIQWIETAPAVKGLGNFSDRLAFDSAWLVFAAFASGSWLVPGGFHAPGILLYVPIIIEGCWRLARLLRGEFRVSHVLAVIFLVAGRRLFSLEFSSPGTDMPATLLVWLAFLYSLDLVENHESGYLTAKHWVILIASLLAVVIKLSALPVLILPIFFFLSADRKNLLRPLAAVLVTGILLVVPWLARNLILSGYLVYPLPQIDLFNPTWKIPPAKAFEAQKWITAWARLPDQNVDQVMALSFNQWVPQWWSAQEGFDRLILGGIGISWLLAGIGLAIRQLRSNLMPGHFAAAGMVALAGWVGGLFWFLQAPAMRFGYGFLIFLLGYPVAIVLAAVLRKMPARLSYALVSAVLAGILIYQVAGLAAMRNVSEWRSRWLVPSSYPTVAVRNVTQNDFSYHFPVSGNQCWYAPIPCTPFPNEQAWLLGENYLEGFLTKTR